MAIGAWVVALGLSITAAWTVPLLFGEEYTSGVPVLRVVTFTMVPISMRLALSQYLIAENMIKIDTMRLVVGMVINVVLNYVLISRMGIIGAAWATLSARIISDVLVTGLTSARGQIRMILRAILGLVLCQLPNDG